MPSRSVAFEPGFEFGLEDRGGKAKLYRDVRGVRTYGFRKEWYVEDMVLAVSGEAKARRAMARSVLSILVSRAFFGGGLVVVFCVISGASRTFCYKGDGRSKAVKIKGAAHLRERPCLIGVRLREI